MNVGWVSQLDDVGFLSNISRSILAADWHRATTNMLLKNVDKLEGPCFFAVALVEFGEPTLDDVKLQIIHRIHPEILRTLQLLPSLKDLSRKLMEVL